MINCLHSMLHILCLLLLLAPVSAASKEPSDRQELDIFFSNALLGEMESCGG